jgi:hypothetical protein
MNRKCSIAIGTLLLFALTSLAQQSSNSNSAKNGLATVPEQLKMLTKRLDLAADQQSKIKPALEDLHDATIKLAEDKSLSHDERMAKIRPLRYETDKKIRAVLNEDQKQKLDQFEQEPHPELHGSLN